MVAEKKDAKVIEMPRPARFSLTVLERVVLPPLLPQKGTYFMLKERRKLLEDLSFSEKEVKALELRDGPNGSVAWNREGEVEVGLKTVTIPESILALTQATLRALDANGQLHIDHLTLYVKMMPLEEEAAHAKPSD